MSSPFAMSSPHGSSAPLHTCSRAPVSTCSAPNASPSSASIARPASGKTSLRLTVKAPPSKLRQAMSGTAVSLNPYADTPSDSDATPAPPPRAARATRNPRTVVDPDSDELDEDLEDAMEEEDAAGEVDAELLHNDDSEEDADGEEDDEEEDEEEEEEMPEDHPPSPVIKQSRMPGQVKPNVTPTAPPEPPLESVEDKDMDDDDDDDELSELDSNEDAEGEEEDEEGEEGSDEDDENSRSATPDLTKLTKRQRGGLVEELGGPELMSLPNEAQKKKHLTAEEHAMRRAEMARRRKNLSEKRNEEKKMDTINKLLSKPAPKRRTRAEMEAARAAEETPNPEGHAPNGPDPTCVRWINRRHASVIMVPQQWQESALAELFPPHVPAPG